MKKFLFVLAVLMSFNTYAAGPFSNKISDGDDSFDKSSSKVNYDEILNQAEDNATTLGRKILELSRIMIANNEVIIGSCWDYINGVYNKAGHPSNLRKTVFKSKLQGPYVDINMIEGGDWLYYVNHSYGGVEHSGVFVAWTNKETKEALIMSYPGGNQSKPARYKTYDLRSVYNIMRPK